MLKYLYGGTFVNFILYMHCIDMNFKYIGLYIFYRSLESKNFGQSRIY